MDRFIKNTIDVYGAIGFNVLVPGAQFGHKNTILEHNSFGYKSFYVEFLPKISHI
jgi:hypothetical protein